MYEQNLSVNDIRGEVNLQLYRAGMEDLFVVKEVFETYVDKSGERHWDASVESPGEIPSAMDLVLMEQILNDAKENILIRESSPIENNRTLH